MNVHQHLESVCAEVLWAFGGVYNFEGSKSLFDSLQAQVYPNTFKRIDMCERTIVFYKYTKAG